MVGMRFRAFAPLASGLGVAAAITAVVVSLGPAASTVHASSSDDRAAGAALYHERGCEHCHGADLAGTEKGPSLQKAGKKLHKDAIEHQIAAGGGGMPAFGDSLQPDEVKQLVEFLAAQKKAPKHSKS